jgi:hypothetical protein
MERHHSYELSPALLFTVARNSFTDSPYPPAKGTISAVRTPFLRQGSHHETGFRAASSGPFPGRLRRTLPATGSPVDQLARMKEKAYEEIARFHRYADAVPVTGIRRRVG